ncbi:MAG: ATP-binding protein [Deltaproteobacteria bacterium]|nr:ATP-binding protein [Deltaproteobacteria bacterium]
MPEIPPDCNYGKKVSLNGSVGESMKASERQSSFRVNADIKDVVGRDLINNDNIAVTELVKNAYDAGALSCSITFSKEKGPSLVDSSLVIQDDGCGMDHDDIYKKWLNIAYSEKKGGNYSGNRRMSGNKGVGRFSCDRLGERLRLYSRKKGATNYVALEVDWKSFEGQDRDTQVSDVPVQFFEILHDKFQSETGVSEFQQGTCLIIFPLRSSWEHEKLLSLRRALERFINPNQEAYADAFKISLHVATHQSADKDKAESRKRVNGEVKNVVFKELGFRTSYIESAIDSGGKRITTSLFHRGERLFSLIERNNFKLLKNVKLVIYFLNQYNKAYFSRETGISSVDYGSIFLFLNGFRVSPLGERGNDWLGLDNRKTQGVRRYLGTRDVMGRIEIGDDENAWRIISSREGIVQTDAYRELAAPYDSPPSFFYAILRKLERYIVDGLEWDGVKDNWSEINSKVLSARSGTIKESYKKTEVEKVTKILQSLQDIIKQGTKLEDVISLDFDPSVILMLKAQNEARRAELLRSFSELAEKIGSNDDLEADSKGGLKEFVHKAAQELTQLKKERDAARQQSAEYKKQRDEAQKERDEAKKERTRIKAEKEVIKRENFFLKAQRNHDIDDVINLHHQIITFSQIISKDANQLLSLLRKNETIAGSNLLLPLGRMRIQSQRILKIARLATSANFKVKAEAITYDVVDFIKAYLSEIVESKLFRDISVTFTATDAEFICRFVPIEVAIMIDSFISNSKKAGASVLSVSIVQASPSSVEFLFDDDGSGLDSSITTPQSVFDRGVTTTDGSGIGLNHAQKIAGEMGGVLSLADSRLGGFALLLRLSNET